MMKQTKEIDKKFVEVGTIWVVIHHQPQGMLIVGCYDSFEAANEKFEEMFRAAQTLVGNKRLVDRTTDKSFAYWMHDGRFLVMLEERSLLGLKEPYFSLGGVEGRD